MYFYPFITASSLIDIPSDPSYLVYTLHVALHYGSLYVGDFRCAAVHNDIVAGYTRTVARILLQYICLSFL